MSIVIREHTIFGREEISFQFDLTNADCQGTNEYDFNLITHENYQSNVNCKYIYIYSKHQKKLYTMGKILTIIKLNIYHLSRVPEQNLPILRNFCNFFFVSNLKTCYETVLT